MKKLFAFLTLLAASSSLAGPAVIWSTHSGTSAALVLPNYLCFQDGSCQDTAGFTAVPGGSNMQLQFNDSGAFGGTAAGAWDKTHNYFGVGLTPGLPIALQFPFQVGSSNSLSPATSPTGTPSYYSAPTPPTTANATGTYSQQLYDTASLAAAQTDDPTGNYVADTTNNFTYYVAGYKTVDGVRLYAPATAATATTSFSDNGDMSTFFVTLNWSAITGAAGYVYWVTGGVHGSGYDSMDVGNVLTFNDNNTGYGAIAFPPTSLGLAYTALGNTSAYQIYDYKIPVGSTKLFSTTEKSVSFTDDSRSQQPPASGSAVINKTGGTYQSTGLTHAYKVYTQYADGGYSTSGLTRSVNDGGPTVVGNATAFSATQDGTCSGYTATGNSMTYTLVSYKNNVSGKTIVSSGVAVNFTDDSSSNPYCVDLSWTAPAGTVPDGYLLYITGGPSSYSDAVQAVAGSPFQDMNNSWGFSYPDNIYAGIADVTGLGAAQNDAETGYGPSDGSYSFTYHLAQQWSMPGGGVVFSPGNPSTVFNDANDGSPAFGIDLTWTPANAPNGVAPVGGVVWVQGTSSGPQHPTLVNQGTPPSGAFSDQNTSWGTFYPPFTLQNQNAPFTYKVDLSWSAVTGATQYYVVKTSGDSGPSYPIFLTTASTSVSDTDDSIWTPSAVNPPLPGESPTTYDIHLSWSGATGSPTDYRILRTFNGGGTTAQDFAASPIIDGNGSFTWTGATTVANTLYHATGAMQSCSIYGYDSTLGIYSTSGASTSVTDNNSGEFYSIAWNATPPTDADNLKFIVNTSNAELTPTGSLPFVDVGTGYNSNTTVTPNTSIPGFYADVLGNVNAVTYTAATTVTSPEGIFEKLGNQTGTVALPNSTAISGFSGGIALGVNAAIDGNDSVGVGTLAFGGGIDTVAVGKSAVVGNNSDYSVTIGPSSLIENATPRAVAIGKSVFINTGGTSSIAIGDTATINGAPDAIAIGTNATAGGTNTLAMMQSSSVGGTGSIGIGLSATETGTNGVAIGTSASGGTSSVSIGQGASATAGNSVAIGPLASASSANQFGIAVGYSATSQGNSLAVGINASANGNGSEIAIGGSANAGGGSAPYTIAIGQQAAASCNSVSDGCIAIGKQITVSGVKSTAIGYGPYTLSTGSTTAVYSPGDVILVPTTYTQTSGGFGTTGYDTSSPTTGSTVTASANKPGLLLTPSGTLATLTIKLPSSPFDGQQYWIATSQMITTTTWQDAGGTSGNVIGAPATLTSSGARFFYNLSGTKWYSIQ